MRRAVRESREMRSGWSDGGERDAGCFFGEECVAAAEPTSHSSVLYQPVPQPCTAPIKLCTVRLFLNQILRHHAGAGRAGVGVAELWAAGVRTRYSERANEGQR